MHSSLASERKVLPRMYTFTCGGKGEKVKNRKEMTCWREEYILLFGSGSMILKVPQAL